MKRGCESTARLGLPRAEATAPAPPTPFEDWATLEIPAVDFDLGALHAALEAKRRQLSLTWTDVVSEISSPFVAYRLRLIRASNLRDLADTRFGVEASIVLLTLIWLGRSPESFVPGHPGGDRLDAQLSPPGAGALPSFDFALIHAKLDAERERRRLSWLQVAREIGSPFTANGLQRFHRGRFIRFPAVMRLTRWLQCPAVSLLTSGPAVPFGPARTLPLDDYERRGRS